MPLLSKIKVASNFDTPRVDVVYVNHGLRLIINDRNLMRRAINPKGSRQRPIEFVFDNFAERVAAGIEKFTRKPNGGILFSNREHWFTPLTDNSAGERVDDCYRRP